jgi:hypothetical protein
MKPALVIIAGAYAVTLFGAWLLCRIAAIADDDLEEL